MSQLPITAYFNTRKRQMCVELNSKSKILLLERDHSNSPAVTIVDDSEQIASNEKANLEKTPNRLETRAHALSATDGSQTNIRDSLLWKASNDSETKKVPVAKMELSPKKKLQTPTKSSIVLKDSMIEEMNDEEEQLSASNCSLISSALMMERLVNHEQLLEQLQKQDTIKKPQMQKSGKMELEVSTSLQKGYKSPIKALRTPSKNADLPKTVSSQTRILLESKEMTSSPIKCSPTKAYQKYLSLAEKSGLVLPYNYRFLAEVFRCVDMVSAILFNRKEVITFNKLKFAIQKQMRRNFTLEHLAQIKTIYPGAYTYHQEKFQKQNFASLSKQKRYELVLTPVVEKNNGRNTPDAADDVLKTASESSISPMVLLERKRKFYNTLLERVKDEHEKFLSSLENPRLMNIPREKIIRWHPEFDVESCKEIEQAELPQPPIVEKPTAKNVLDKAKSLFNCGTRMEKALQRLAEANLTAKSKSPSSMHDSTTQTTEDGIPKVNIAITDNPPITQIKHLNTLFKGIPKALLEKVRARQEAKALEAMTRTPNAALYSRLPELVKFLRNIFVAETKNVLPLEAVIQKLDNSFRTKLTSQEMEEHIRQLCKLIPIWINILNVRKVDYLKLDKNVELAKVIRRLEILINDKTTS